MPPITADYFLAYDVYWLEADGKMTLHFKGWTFISTTQLITGDALREYQEAITDDIKIKEPDKVEGKELHCVLTSVSRIN